MSARIELTWPQKGRFPNQLAAGAWETGELEDSIRQAHPLTPVGTHGDRPTDGLVVTGDRLAALRTLRRTRGQGAKLIYADLPRVEGYDETRSFVAADGRTWGTWLTVVREHLVAAVNLLARDGVLVIQGGDREEAYAKALAYELLHPENVLGSIAWQSHYSPKGGKPGTEIATIHQTLICVARERDAIPRVALPRPAEGYTNPDGDPRGAWKAPQKDAGRDTVDLTYHLPPYRWELVDGSLPPGIWRISPFSGVLWGCPTEAGSWRFRVAVTDQAGKRATRQLTLDVGETIDPPDTPARIWWMDNPSKQEGRLTVSTRRLPDALLDNPYSFVLEASGGEPQVGTTRPSRGWGFGEAKLISAIREDRCHFGRKGNAIPEPKRYLDDLSDGITYANVASWWSGQEVGWSQDAIKHLRSLKEAGIIEEVVETAKPEGLLQRLIEIFTLPGDVVLELFARAGDAAAASIKLGRRFVALNGASDYDIRAAEGCCVPRLMAILDEVAGASQIEPSQPVPDDAVVRGFSHTRVDSAVAMTDPNFDEYPRLVRGDYGSPEMLAQAILTSQGFIAAHHGDGLVSGRSVQGDEIGIVIEPHVFLDRVLAADLSMKAIEECARATIYFFRSDEEFDPGEYPVEVSFKRVPMDLAL